MTTEPMTANELENKFDNGEEVLQHFDTRKAEVKLSLRDRILAANSEQEIDELLKEGAAYPFAHPSTQRKWNKAAQRKRKALNERGTES